MLALVFPSKVLRSLGCRTVLGVPRLPVNQPVDNFMATLCADGDIKADSVLGKGLQDLRVLGKRNLYVPRRMADTAFSSSLPPTLREASTQASRTRAERNQEAACPNSAALSSRTGLLHASKDRAPSRRLECGIPSQHRGPHSSIKQERRSP